MSNFTVIVPTFDRPHLLRACLTFLRRQDSEVQVIVADSSGDKQRLINRESVRAFGSGIDYLEFDGCTRLVQKLLMAVDQVSAKYVCICADDDLLVLKSAFECAEFLSRNPDYVACHGHYLRFSLIDSGSILFEDWEYRGPSLTGDSPSKRVIDLLSNYEALFYSVQATPMLRMSLEAMTTSPYNMHQELANALWLAMAGKIKRIDGLYNLRQAGNSALHPLAEPYSYIAQRCATVMSDYASMAGQLTAKFKSAYPVNEEADLFQTLCFGFMVHLYRSINLIDLARQMIPNYSENDLRPLRLIRPPTFMPSIPFALKQIMERAVRHLRRKAPARRTPVAVRSKSTGQSVYISRVLNNGLTRRYREEIRELF
jgi:glycosyltransferase domain-containing protein